MRLAFAALSLSSVLVGCSGNSTGPDPLAMAPGGTLRGTLRGGQQPIVGAHVYLFAAGTGGYGTASVSLLNSSATGHSDATGAYALTDGSGNFSITVDYNCTANSQVYLLALGGNPGAGVNSAVGLMAILGNCPAATTFSSSLFIAVNEVTTIAAAYAFAPYATDPTHVGSSGTTLALQGIANAFANASNLVDTASGTALTETPANNRTAPQARINTLGNILAACVNSTGPASTGCSTLFANNLSGGSSGTAPADTAAAAINMAHNSGSNIANRCDLLACTTP